jgi:hypothetical protein
LAIQNVLNQIITKHDGTTKTYKIGDIIEGYYDSLNDKFFEEQTFETEIEASPGYLYVDLAENSTYIYKASILKYIKVSGEGSDIKYGYYSESDGKFFEDKEHEHEIPADATKLYTDLVNDTLYRFDTILYTDVTETLAEDANPAELELYESDGAETPTYTLTEDTTVVEGKHYYEKTGTDQYIKLGASQDYEPVFGIDINTSTNEIKTTDFIGTEDEWNALDDDEKLKYDFLHFSDTFNIDYYPGHLIYDNNLPRVQRPHLEFKNFEVNDDIVNNRTIIEEIPYTAGSGIEIDEDKEISISDDVARVWTGTKAEWEAVTDKNEYEGWTIHITDDALEGAQPVVDVAEDGNYNPISSHGVAAALGGMKLAVMDCYVIFTDSNDATLTVNNMTGGTFSTCYFLSIIGKTDYNLTFVGTPSGVDGVYSSFTFHNPDGAAGVHTFRGLFCY